MTFNPEDFNSMIDMMNNYENYTTTISAANEKNEKVCISVYEDKIVTRTYQKNYWIRENVYHRDGTSEEMYDSTLFKIKRLENEIDKRKKEISKLDEELDKLYNKLY